jgi:AbrB family looped-hinge helix DNA binding protein
VDRAGRIVLPKSLRQTLRISPGDTLQVESDEDRIILSPVRIQPGLQKEQGVWVYRSGTKVSSSVAELVEQQREQRTRELLGDHR